MKEWLAQISLADTKNPAFDGRARVYMVLKWHERNKGIAWPSIPTIAELTGLHERTVQRAIKILIASELIGKQSRTSEKGDPDTNLYTFPERHVAAATPPPPCEDATRVVAAGATRVVAQRATTWNKQLNRQLNKDARARAPDGRRRERFERDPAADEALMAKCRMKAFKHGIWLPEWGDPPPPIEDAASISHELGDHAEPIIPDQRRETRS